MHSYIVIPARVASTRLPRKLLLDETGKTLIQHTYEAAGKAELPAGVCVAAGDEEIARAVRRFGGEVELTSADARSGTDRVAEIARRRDDVDLFINVQGDEPEILGSAIDQTVQLLLDHPDAAVATLATPLRSRQRLEDPSCVKVVCDRAGYALYFSRSPIPHPREWNDQLLSADPPVFLQHVGVYGYRRDFLLELDCLPGSVLERTESLEQLRVLQAGRRIVVGVVEHSAQGIDTAADYAAFVSRVTSC
ncbi:MAG: 3-deoxy-manno-octulosonate cytidylyltransferase [Pirellulaceae bacterium]|nr:3-deoxy-manno-octulosonate cytidylyltransferase [Pirellulaceae bacterium]MDP7015751.1 3-deoxy-manno-octulosonate cytidylyltransferase [Pirellulaceae bacterium]